MTTGIDPGLPAVRMAVVIPVGPREDLADLTDTLDSIHAFMPADTLLLILNDGARSTVHGVAARSGLAAEVLDLPGDGHGVAGGLTWTIAQGMRRALDHRDVDVVLRMDTDALVIGPGLGHDARVAFAADTGVGVLGSFDRISTGEVRDFGPAASALHQDLGANRIRHPVWSSTLRRALRQARRNGYVDGEHALGGAQLVSRTCLLQLARAGLLPAAGVIASRMGEDQFLGLAVRAVGLRTLDFATGSKPLALRWHGLPGTPPELVRQGKLVAHSVKTHEDVDGRELREWFRDRRSRVVAV